MTPTVIETFTDEPVIVDEGMIMEYHANRCRHHRGEVCDRHIAHAHSCQQSSSSKKRDRHELVKNVRSELIAEVGYTDMFVEPRTNKESNQKRADIFSTDKTVLGRHVHYYTDDTIGHPLCKTYISDEVKDLTAQHTILELEKTKARKYRDFILKAKAHPAVIAGARIVNYKTIAMTSLGEMGDDAVKFFNGCFSFLKKRLCKEARIAPRPDGLGVKDVVSRARFRYRILV